MQKTVCNNSNTNKECYPFQFGTQNNIKLSLRKVCRKQTRRVVRVKYVDHQDRETGKAKARDLYPAYEANDPKEGPFPVRNPGNYPPASVHSEEDQPTKEPTEEFDPLRDGPLRFLGYANELGEAFAAWLPPGGVPLSYAVAIAYVLTDTFDKGRKAIQVASKDLTQQSPTNEGVNYKMLVNILGGERALDTVVWQLLASVAIPGATIHFIVAITHYVLTTVLGLDQNQAADQTLLQSYIATMATVLNTDAETVLKYVLKSVPTMVGLTAIPFIVHPIDNGVHAVLNHTLRPAMRVFICDNAKGQESGLEVCSLDSMGTDFPMLKGQGPFGKIGENMISRSNLGSIDEDVQFWDAITEKSANDQQAEKQTTLLNGNPPQSQPADRKITSTSKTQEQSVSGISSPSQFSNLDQNSSSQSNVYKFVSNQSQDSSLNFEDCEIDSCGLLCQYRRSRDQGRYHGTVSGAIAHAAIVVVPIGAVLIWSHLHAHMAQVQFESLL
eukprot:TRINITY_DN655_c0_g3_i1.p1 TRINITY_DN655_c0_g3~~TRINITY_DN655_c0_g3_i1.p1  ORF type:complete len:498 (+),score=67.77 TRINITY_DN655_c0_g3_i1:110-1603(+)